MVDVGVIASGLSSLKLALDITKEFRNIDTSFKDAEVKLKLTELLEALSDAKFALHDARDENLELKEKVKLLELQLSRKDEVVFKNDHYYLKTPIDGKPEGPFCSNCFSKNNELSLLTEVLNRPRSFGKYKCPSCRQAFDK